MPNLAHSALTSSHLGSTPPASVHHATVCPAGISCFALSVPSGQIAALPVPVSVVVVVVVHHATVSPAGISCFALSVLSGQMAALSVVVVVVVVVVAALVHHATVCPSGIV